MMTSAPSRTTTAIVETPVVGTTKSDHKKKRKHQESSPASQDGSEESVVEELLKQYETYKNQFEEWTAKNKGNVSQEAYDKYVDDFRGWEKVVLGQIKTATKKHKSSKKKDKKKSKGDKTPRDQVEVQETSTLAKPAETNVPPVPFDPMAMMMTMAMMMMPAMMQQQQHPQPQPVQAVPVIPTSGMSAMPPVMPQQQQQQQFTLTPVLPQVQQTAALAPQQLLPTSAVMPSSAIMPSSVISGPVQTPFLPPKPPSRPMPDMSRPPPNIPNMPACPRMIPPVPSAPSTISSAIPFDDSRRTTIDYGHRGANEFDNFWFRNNQDHSLANGSSPAGPSSGTNRPPIPPGPVNVYVSTPQSVPPANSRSPEAASVTSLPPIPFAGRSQQPPTGAVRSGGQPPLSRHSTGGRPSVPPPSGPPVPLFPNGLPGAGPRDEDHRRGRSPPHRSERSHHTGQRQHHKFGARDFSVRQRRV